MKMKTINKTILFLLLTFGICFSMASIFWFNNGDLKSIPGLILSVCYMFIPMLSVLIIEKLIYHNELVKSLKISFKLNKWFLIGWLIMPFAAFLTLGISLLYNQISFTPNMAGMVERFSNMMTPEQLSQMKDFISKLSGSVIFLILGQGMIAGISINAIAGFGEELGWRGFLLKQFSNMSFLKASLVIGFIWGIWHAPLILMGHNYPQHPQIGVLMMVVWCILLTPIFIYITLKAKSVIAAAILHGTLNGVAGISIMFIKGGNDITVGLTGLSGFIALAIIILCLFIYDFLISKQKIMLHSIKQSIL